MIDLHAALIICSDMFFRLSARSGDKKAVDVDESDEDYHLPSSQRPEHLIILNPWW